MMGKPVRTVRVYHLFFDHWRRQYEFANHPSLRELDRQGRLVTVEADEDVLTDMCIDAEALTFDREPGGGPLYAAARHAQVAIAAVLDARDTPEPWPINRRIHCVRELNVAELRSRGLSDHDRVMALELEDGSVVFPMRMYPDRVTLAAMAGGERRLYVEATPSAEARAAARRLDDIERCMDC